MAKILELNCLAMVKGDTVYLKKRFFCILSEFVIGLHRELEPMVAELVRLTIIQISDEDEKNECKAEDKQKS